MERKIHRIEGLHVTDGIWVHCTCLKTNHIAIMKSIGCLRCKRKIKEDLL